jgi:chemotaxis protein methyltransferase CheR
LNLSPGEFAQLRDLVHRLCGLAVAEEKTYLLQHRLEPVARSAGCPTFAAFLQKLNSPAGAALREPIIEAVTTAETAFFRDSHPFDAFRRTLLPRLVGARLRRPPTGGMHPLPTGSSAPASPVRLWSAGVATGQEAYSLAMIVDDFLVQEGAGLRAADFAILATDISPAVLATARAGSYADREMARGVSPSWQARYFRRAGTGWQIDPRLQKMIEFRRLNLMDPIDSLGSMDTIFCRNVLIYFDEAARRRICDRFADLLVPGGYLILGVVENLYGISTRFVSEFLGPSLVYRRI